MLPAGWRQWRRPGEQAGAELGARYILHQGAGLKSFQALPVGLVSDYISSQPDMYARHDLIIKSACEWLVAVKINSSIPREGCREGIIDAPGRLRQPSTFTKKTCIGSNLIQESNRANGPVCGRQGMQQAETAIIKPSTTQI